MNETPPTLDNSILETPVPDTTLFLLHERNRAFLAGKLVRPHLSKPQGNSGWYWALVAGVFYMFCVFCGGFEAILSRLPDITLPPLPDLPTPTESGMILFLLILLFMGVLVVVRDYWLTRKPPIPIPSVSPASEKPVKVRREEPEGQVLEGTVVQAEKIVVQKDGVMEEKIGVRYQFAAPGGVITNGYAVGRSEDASHPMAPIPDTPVKIYYTRDGKHHLL